MPDYSPEEGVRYCRNGNRFEVYRLYRWGYLSSSACVSVPRKNHDYDDGYGGGRTGCPGFDHAYVRRSDGVRVRLGYVLGFCFTYVCYVDVESDHEIYCDAYLKIWYYDTWVYGVERSGGTS